MLLHLPVRRLDLNSWQLMTVPFSQHDKKIMQKTVDTFAKALQYRVSTKKTLVLHQSAPS